MKSVFPAMADPPVPGFHPYAPGAHSPDCLPSPVSELAQCFTGLGAFETGVYVPLCQYENLRLKVFFGASEPFCVCFTLSDTPRRRLDLSNISAEGPDAAVLLESPKHEANTDQSVSLLSPWDSPAPRNSRMKKFRSFLPQLLCSSPKSHSGSQGQQGPPNSNKENVAAWDGQHARSEGRAHISDPYQQGTSEPLALGSPISSAPLSPPLDFLRNKCTDGFMEVVEEQEE
ncbi:hypothetical protein Z043_111457, partial [Scleropages formosus]